MAGHQARPDQYVVQLSDFSLKFTPPTAKLLNYNDQVGTEGKWSRNRL